MEGFNKNQIGIVQLGYQPTHPHNCNVWLLTDVMQILYEIGPREVRTISLQNNIITEKSAKRNMQVPRMAQFEWLSSTLQNTP